MKIKQEYQFTMFLNLFPQRYSLVPLLIMVGNPQSCHAGPEWAGKGGKGMEEAVVNDLIKDPKSRVN